MLSNYTYILFIQNETTALQWAFKLNKAPAMVQTQNLNGHTVKVTFKVMFQ